MKSYEFDDFFFVAGNPEPVGGYKITDDYAVFKLTTFQILTDVQGKEFAAVSVWSNCTAAAKAKGIKKAMIDISGNGGG